MKLPIILNENGDITRFDSISEAESWIEANDVENNEYIATDAVGNKLELKVVEEVTPVLFGLFKVRLKKVRIYET